MEEKQVEGLQERISKRQEVCNQRHMNLSNGVSLAFSKNYTYEDLTEKAKGFLDGSINAVELGVEKCNEFTIDCRSALKSLDIELLKLKTTAGLTMQLGKNEEFLTTQKKIENIEAQITLLKQFT
ncbi:hypothetical protein [Lysinibacillus sp. BPa_S21]|uniref:hypothetical protein n=1 Tax=Lysinibacillus sp. BPa_S21 TaxID=2932478 RepID=UPI0020111205|nr:hypothetical protein [Lysinibacillus sp. BPa_S21]MCL1698316.1 hypothetical protein [Lysinibacillus sp. BPa_S21]